MNTLVKPQPRQAPPPGLLLHCGATQVGREEVFAVPTPRGTDTWFPLPHQDLVLEVESQLRDVGFTLEAQGHGLSHDGARYFGVLQVSLPDREPGDYSWIVGLRNSHDKSYPAGLVAGTHVLVCDNMSFSGEVRLSRKHTRHAARDLRHLTARAVGQLGDRFHRMDESIAAYREDLVPDWAAHDLTIRAVDCRAITTGQIPAVSEQWRNPQDEEFRPRTLWSWFNCVTEVHKKVSPSTAMARGEALHGLCDAVVGLAS